MTIGEGRNENQTVNLEFRLSAQLSLQHNGPVQRLHHCRCHTDLLFNLHRHSSLTQDPELFDLLHLGQDILLDLEKAPFFG